MFHCFLVEPNSEAAAIVEGFKAVQKARDKAIDDFRLDLGVPDVEPFGTHASITGFGTVPFKLPGWKWSKKYGTNVPDRTTVEGKVAAKRMAALPPGVDRRNESSRIFGHGACLSVVGRSLGMAYAAWAWSERGAVCCMTPGVKDACKKWPAGLKEITLTEAKKIVEIE